MKLHRLRPPYVELLLEDEGLTLTGAPPPVTEGYLFDAIEAAVDWPAPPHGDLRVWHIEGFRSGAAPEFQRILTVRPALVPVRKSAPVGRASRIGRSKRSRRPAPK